MLQNFTSQQISLVCLFHFHVFFIHHNIDGSLHLYFVGSVDKPDKVLNGADHDLSGDEAEKSEEVDDPDSHCYDKAKSFFDSISCEALERAKGSATIIAISHKRCIAVPSELKNKR